MNQSKSPVPLLVADIGATHARFAVWVDGDLHAQTRYPTEGARSGAELVTRFLDEHPAEFRGVSLAVAGPVQDGFARLTNSAIHFDSDSLAEQTGVTIRLVNDFAAVAAAVPFLEPEGLSPIRSEGSETSEDAEGSEAPALPGRRKAVIGPGSGLGMAALIPQRERWLVLSSEGGHCDLPATDPLEAEVVRALQVDDHSVSWETCLSGPGILALYGAVCTVWGCAAEYEQPERVTQGAAAGDPVCAQTVEMFWGMLGNAAGNLALVTCATGGVFVAGGIVPGILDQLDPRHFRRRFEQRGALCDFARQIPTAVIVDASVGLYGAAHLFDGDADVLP